MPAKVTKIRQQDYCPSEESEPVLILRPKGFSVAKSKQALK
jgi:hypothetical protein